jgi:hypothetical protein
VFHAKLLAEVMRGYELIKRSARFA